MDYLKLNAEQLDVAEVSEVEPAEFAVIDAHLAFLGGGCAEVIFG